MLLRRISNRRGIAHTEGRSLLKFDSQSRDSIAHDTFTPVLRSHIHDYIVRDEVAFAQRENHIPTKLPTVSVDALVPRFNLKRV